MPIRLARADTVIFLDYSRLVSTFRALKRQLLNRGRSVQAEGCPERFDAAFIRWVWRYNRESRPTTLALIRQHAPHANLLVLRKPREAEALLVRLARVRRSS
jgi:adenylate kinase family enzyme